MKGSPMKRNFGVGASPTKQTEESPNKMTDESPFLMEDTPGADSPLYQRFVRQWKENRLNRKLDRLDKKHTKRLSKAKKETDEAKEYQSMWGDEVIAEKDAKRRKKGHKKGEYEGHKKGDQIGYTFSTWKERREYEKEKRQSDRAKRKLDKTTKKYNKIAGEGGKLDKLRKKRAKKRDYPQQQAYHNVRDVKTSDLDQ